jgi:alanine-synthesizing transaminase
VLSRRTAWDLAGSAFVRRLEALRAEGTPLLDLAESNPTRCGLRWDEGELRRALAEQDLSSYRPWPRGSPEARRAVAGYLSGRGAEVDPERVILSASTSEGYALLLKLLCDPGDEVLVPLPSYPLFQYLADLESVRVRSYPLRYDGTWHVDLPALRDALTDRTRAIVAVSPNNPTGSFVKTSEAEALREIAAPRGLALVSDEVFADFPLRPDPTRASSLFEDGPALTLCLGGLSKSCGLPQLKLAWMALAGPRAAREETRARLEILADTYLSVSTPVQHAAPAVLARKGELQAPIHARIKANLALLRGLAADTAATVLDVEGGWSAVLQVPATRSEDEWVTTLLEEDGVLVHPGYFFDFEREAFLVVSLLPRPETFAGGVTRLLGRVASAAP